MITYDLHPQARIDLDEIWDFIAEDNLADADKVIADILPASTHWRRSPVGATNARSSPHAPYDLCWCVTT
jgi:plasmid stabilization system protein ParE